MKTPLVDGSAASNQVRLFAAAWGILDATSDFRKGTDSFSWRRTLNPTVRASCRIRVLGFDEFICKVVTFVFDDY